MSGKSLGTFLFQSFSDAIRQDINVLMKNFPNIDENQKKLTKPILNYLVDYNVNIDNFINKCCILSSVNLKNFFQEILEFFNQIPLDMTKTNYNAPLFFNDEMKEKSISSFQLRLCTYYISHSILAQIIYHIVLRTNFLKSDDFPLVYSIINQILFHEINEINSFKLDLINVSKWSVILHTMSKTIPDIIISDSFNHIQSSQLLHNNYHIFILRLYSFLYYPKHILNNFPLISVTFQHLISILTSNRATNQLLIAGNKFIRNFLGYTIQYEYTPDLIALFKEINRCLNKKQNDQCSWNSTLVLFNTLSNEKLSFFPLPKYFTLITRQFPTNSYKITDMIKTFISILNGHFYMNLFTIEKIDLNFFKSQPNRKDKIYLQKMLEIIYSNSAQFKHCQKELGLFLSKVASFNFAWFIRKPLNNLINKEFFQFNSEAVLYCATVILSNEKIILQNSKITSPNDSIVVQFKKSIIELCQKVMDDHPIDSFTSQCWIFDTNDFTSSLSVSSLSYEIEQIIGHTSLKPLVVDEAKKDVAVEVFSEIDQKINVLQPVKFDHFLNNVNESALRYYQLNPIVHSSIENALLLCLLLAQEIEKSSPHVFYRISMYIFSNSPFVSALTIRIIQAFVHVKHDQSILNSLLTLQAFEYEQLYIYGLALIRTVKSLVNCKIGLTVNSSNSLLSWQWILLSSPFSIIRKLGLYLAESVVPILPYENFPNFHKFLEKHDEEIFSRSMKILALTFTYKDVSVERLKHVKFTEVLDTDSYLLYFSFFSHALRVFSMNEDKCPQLNHTMNLTHAQAISLINAKKNNESRDNVFFMLNLITLRLATSSVFDKYTSADQILTLLRQGENLISLLNFYDKLYCLFFFSVNPCLELSFPLPFCSIYVGSLTFHFRLYMIENRARKSLANYINIRNYKSIVLAEKEYLEDARVGRQNDDLGCIEKALRNALFYFNSCRFMKLWKIMKFDFERMIIVGNSSIPNSIVNLLAGLKILFKQLRGKMVVQNDSFFGEGQISRSFDQPFDPNLWFPLFFGLSVDTHNNCPIITKLAKKVLSLFVSFVQVPESFIAHVFNEEFLSTYNKERFWSLILAQHPKSLLALFCQISTVRNKLFFAVFDCFRKPSGFFMNDLENIKGIIQKVGFQLKNEFDLAVIENLGTLICLSFFNLSIENSDFSCLNVIYFISLFAVISDKPQSEKLNLLLIQILNTHSNREIPMMSQLVDVSQILAVSFKPYTEQFFSEFFEILSINRKYSKSDLNAFIQFSLPWFNNVCLCSGNVAAAAAGCGPSVFAPYAFLKKLFSIGFIQNGIEINFSQIHLTDFSQSILNVLSKSSLKYIVDFVLREKESTSILIFLLIKYSKSLVPYFVDHLRFEFSYFMEIQSNQRKLYCDVIDQVLDVLGWILLKKGEMISPYLHILFVYCYSRQSSYSGDRKIVILNEIRRLFGRSRVVDCLGCLIGDDRKASEEAVHEIFMWTVSFDDLKDSMFSMELFQYLIDRKMVTSHSYENYVCDIVTNVRTICTLLSQDSGTRNVPLYCEYVSKLMLVLRSLGRPPFDIAVELFQCNSIEFSPILETSLSIVSENIEKTRKKAKEVFLNLITADLSDSIIESIFGLITDMIVENVFSVKDDIEVFFFIIPYFQVNSAALNRSDGCGELKVKFLREVFGNEQSELIVNSYINAINHDGTISSMIDEEFGLFILKMVNRISGEIQFHIFTFFMKVVDICEYKYFHSIYLISLVLLKNRKPHSALTFSVFSPLSKFLISHQNDRGKLNELIEFIQLFEGVDSNILSFEKSTLRFPSIFHCDEKFELSFVESYPVVFLDFRQTDSDFVDLLHSFVMSVQNVRLIKQEKKYNDLKVQTVEKPSTIQFDVDLEKGIERIDKLIGSIDKKKTYLNPADVSKMIKVDCSVFRQIENIDELIE